ncbi:anti-sigma factor [Pseudorhodobacter ferrugineus]|uniref:anti-sigma factor n=1 Tax=Pseudorhodobacter ferrugineus TaxID=77008 RepID=UPI0003B455AF|nr:anti-sigma factor [Pseudorhodobacter ferrugineus]
MTDQDTPQDDADMLAAEYVLGTLPLYQREAAATRVRRDTHFALAVARWEDRLSPLNDTYEDAPAPDLLPQIEARLFAVPAKAPKRAFWQSWFGGVAVAAALGVAVLVFLPTAPQPFVPLTQLTADASDLRYEVGLRDNELRISRVAGAPAEAGRVHELWLIIGNAPPVSLGLIDGAELTLASMGLSAGMILAISLEPTGGSPTGAPTGPVLVTGVVEKI